MKKKKQRTRWIWWSTGSPGNFLRVGIIYNKAKGNPYDIIRIQSYSSKRDKAIEQNMRIDEAMEWVAGLSKVLVYILFGEPEFPLKDFYEDMFKTGKYYWWKKDK